MDDIQKKLSPSQYLIDAVANSELLIVYAAEHGLDIQKEHLKVVIEAKEAYENDAWNKEIEIEFWIVYKNLSRLAHPISIDSLKAAQETFIKQPNFFQRLIKKKRRTTLTHRSVRFYTLFAIASMISMLSIYIYFFIGTLRLDAISDSKKKMTEMETRLGELQIIIGTDQSNKSALLEKEKLENEFIEEDMKKASNIKLLEEWIVLFRYIITFETSKKETSPDAEPMATSPAMRFIDNSIGVIQEAQNYVLILGLYILPLFFGLLGGITYVLRDLVTQTKKLIFSKETNINYTLRILLGTLAGLAVGLFWGDIKSQNQLEVLESLGPLVVAFLAGLLVEYVFNGIEQWVSALINRSLEPKTEKTEKSEKTEKTE